MSIKHSPSSDLGEDIAVTADGGFNTSPSLTNLAELASEKQYLDRLKHDSRSAIKGHVPTHLSSRRRGMPPSVAHTAARPAHEMQSSSTYPPSLEQNRDSLVINESTFPNHSAATFTLGKAPPLVSTITTAALPSSHQAQTSLAQETSDVGPPFVETEMVASIQPLAVSSKPSLQGSSGIQSPVAIADGSAQSNANFPEVPKVQKLPSSPSLGDDVEEPDWQVPEGLRLSAGLIRQGVSAVINDSFTRCFVSSSVEPWNWNVYLFPMWIVGVVCRYFVLFPLRLFALVLGWLIVVPLWSVAKGLRPIIGQKKAQKCEGKLAQLLCSVFVLSWSGVIKLHGTRPTPQPQRGSNTASDKRKSLPGVFVANHSSMIDFIILQQSASYSVVGQKHPGWVGVCQDYLLGCLDPIWFNRGETKNRKAVAEKLYKHAHDADKIPLLIFPEGTCVNNEYVVQFKKAVFELGVPVNPIAIKYNKTFVDAFWNSRAQSFAGHLFNLMTSWAVVCDVWYLDPMSIQPGETSVEFAKRVQVAIARRAGLKAVDWDGYMKYWKPSERFIQARQQQVAEELRDMCPSEASSENCNNGSTHVSSSSTYDTSEVSHDIPNERNSSVRKRIPKQE